MIKGLFELVGACLGLTISAFTLIFSGAVILARWIFTGAVWLASALARGVRAFVRQYRRERDQMAAERAERDAEDASDLEEEQLPEGEEEEPEEEPEQVREGDEYRALLPLYGENLDKAIARVQRQLLFLYRRKDKLTYINNTSPEAWAKYQQTKTWRGLMWDIEQAEDTLDRLERAAAA